MVVELGKTPSNEVRNAVDVLVGALEPDCELPKVRGELLFQLRMLTTVGCLEVFVLSGVHHFD